MRRRSHNFSFGSFHNPPRRPRAAVTTMTVTQKRRVKCAACGQHIAANTQAVRARLRKIHRRQCPTCQQTPRGVKKFHPQCVPTNLEAFMGHNPTVAPPQPAPAPCIHCFTMLSPGHSCMCQRQRATFTPPPTSRPAPAAKPVTEEGAALAALEAIEHAVLVRARKRGVTADVEKQFKTYQSLKSRALRPGTPAEGETAMSITLQRAIKMVF